MANGYTGLVTLYLAVFLLAINGLFAKSIPLDATAITLLRSIVAVAVIMSLIAIQKVNFKLTSRSKGLGVYGLGLLLTLHWISYFHSMQVSSVAVGMLALFSYPVITVFLDSFFTKKRPQTQDIIAGICMLLGVLIMVAPDILSAKPTSNNVHQPTNNLLAGAAWGVCSACLFAIRNTLQKHYFEHTASSTLMAHQLIAVIVLIIPFADYPRIQTLPVKGWGLVILLGIFSTALAHTLLSKALKLMPAKSVAMIGCLAPVFGALLAWGVLGEKPGLSVFIGGAIIIGISLNESRRMQVLSNPEKT